MLSLIKHLVFFNIIISFGAASFLIFSFLVLGQSINWYAVLFSFSSTLLMYNLQRLHKLGYQKINKENERHLWISKNKRRIQFIIVVCGLLLAMLIPFFSMIEIVGLGLLGVLSFFYSFKTKYGNLRDIPGAKIFLIAFVWTGSILIFTYGNTIDRIDLILAFYNFIFILAITIPFDIRDLDFDEERHKTIPQLIGVLPSRIASFLLIWVAYFLLTLIIGTPSIFLSLIYGIFALFCLFSNPTRKELYFSGIMDFTLTIATLWLYIYLNVDFLHF